VLLSQIFHPGREIMESSDGLLAVAYSASACPTNASGSCRANSTGADRRDRRRLRRRRRRLHQAGLDGVEVVASHGYLPAQFINPRVNRRSDGYNGDLDARLRFTREVLAAVRAATDDAFIVGLRSADERDPRADRGRIAGRRASAARRAGLRAHRRRHLGLAWRRHHIVPPMAIEAAYLRQRAGTFKARLDIPLFVTGASTSRRKPNRSSPAARPTSAA
jgi:2,4-dienoyl-CoA reductase-like NADH-dependent reductase (Old Yellow Enzyme family)